MKRSDEILAKSQERALTKSERRELREAYNHEQLEDEKSRSKLGDSVHSFKDEVNLNQPRHRMRGKCASFIECPFDFKCRNYNPTYIKCLNCELNETDDICKKPRLHNEHYYNQLIIRERVNLDESSN